MMMLKNIVLLSSLIAIAYSADAIAKVPTKTEKPLPTTVGSAYGIAAVVGEQAISSFDVNSRIKFVVATARISNSPDVIAGLKPQIIRTLIDESLQVQEAARNGITVTEKEIDATTADIEAQRGMPKGTIARMLSASNVPAKTFRDQIRAQISWGKLLAKTVRGRIKISDAEVASAKNRFVPEEEVTPVKIHEMKIAVINLPIDKPQQEGEIRKIGEKLYGELRKGANFEEVARQFSSGGDASAFWIRPEQLDPSISQVLRQTKEGTITTPIRTHDGVSIIKLVSVKADKPEPKKKKEDSKDAEVTLKEILLKLKPNATYKEADVLLQISEAVAKNPGSCEEKGVASISDLDEFDIEVNQRTAMLSELPSGLRNISETLKVGGMSSPFASAEGIRLYMLCGKKEIAGSSVNSNKIRDSLFRQKFELEAQKYLRDLRRNVFIEVR